MLERLFAVVWQTIPTLYPVEDGALLEPMNAAFAERARATSSEQYVKAYVALQQEARGFAEFCARYDVVLTPTLALPPVPVGWVREPSDPWEQYRRAGEFTPFTPVGQRRGAARRLGAPRLDGRRPPARDPPDRPGGRRGRPAPPCLAARAGEALARPASTGVD